MSPGPQPVRIETGVDSGCEQCLHYQLCKQPMGRARVPCGTPGMPGWLLGQDRADLGRNTLQGKQQSGQHLGDTPSAPTQGLETRPASEETEGWRKTQTAPDLSRHPIPIPHQRAQHSEREVALESHERGVCWQAPVGTAPPGETLTASQHGRYHLLLHRKQNQVLQTEHDSYPPSKILILAGSPLLEAGASSSGFPRFSSDFCALARSFWPSGETSEGR